MATYNTFDRSQLFRSGNVELSDLGISDGTAGQALITDGSGNFSFGDVSASSLDVYATVDDLPLSGQSDGALSFVSSTKRLYIWSDSGWYNIALINTNPSITGGYNASYDFALDGTPIEITLVGTDPEGVPLTWSYEVTSGSLTNGGGATATVSQAGNVFTVTPSTTEAYAGAFSITWKASDGINLATAVSEFTLQWSPIGQAEYTTPGTYSWTAPDGVTSVCVVAIGGGGGGAQGFGYNSRAIAAPGGGGLGWKNNISVVPGQSYTVVVGAGGVKVYGPLTNPGEDSYFIDTSTVAGFGAAAGTSLTLGGVGGGYVGDGGGNGGNGGDCTSNFRAAGSGGAGGYSGNGGRGGDTTTAGSNGSGGGAGGGGGSTTSVYSAGGAGGGVGIYGEGSSGSGGATRAGGGGGSGGTNGGDAIGQNSGSMQAGAAGVYGGGGGSVCLNYGGETPSDGAGGAVRIIWGSNRAFPSTLTVDLDSNGDPI